MPGRLDAGLLVALFAAKATRDPGAEPDLNRRAPIHSDSSCGYAAPGRNSRFGPDRL